jgi:hypothetical protein
MAVDIDTVFTTEGITSVNFFNGRILTAEDLRTFATAGAEHRRVLGRALGPGIATGLRASAAGGLTVNVTSGVAVNQLGDAIDLPVDVDVDVGRTAPTPTGSPTTLFAECPGAASDEIDATVVAGAIYLLTIRPASRDVGQAPGADAAGIGSVCGPGSTRAGVRFRRVALDLGTLFGHPEVVLSSGALSLTDPVGRSLLRNQVAHLFLGTPWLIAQSRSTDEPGPLEQAWDDTNLDACEVPIAVLGIRGQQIVFVDEWAVRRLPTLREVDPRHGWDLMLDERRRAVGIGSVLQFQDQLNQRLDESSTLAALDDFAYLPGAGILPHVTGLFGPSPSPEQTSIPFFGTYPHRAGDLFIRAHEVEPILRSAAAATPVRLSAVPPRPVNVFYVTDSGSSTPGEQAYAVFVYDEHWSGMRATIVDLVGTIDDLVQRLEVLEADDAAVAGVRVVAPREVPTLTEGGHVDLDFLVRVGSAGTYAIEDPVVTFKNRDVTIPVVTSIRNSRSFSTDEADNRTVTVRVEWKKRRSPFPFGRGTLAIDEGTSGGTFGIAGESLLGLGDFGIGGAGGGIGDDFGVIGGGLPSTAAGPFGGADVPGFRLPTSTAIARVRLTVRKTDEPTTSGFDDAAVAFSS